MPVTAPCWPGSGTRADLLADVTRRRQREALRRQCVTMFTEELLWLSAQDKTLIMGQAICAWWGWDRPA